MNSRIDLRIDISRTIGLGISMQTAVWVYVPEPSHLRQGPPIILLAFPGGTYGRSYYDLHVPGRSGYSFADHLVEAGFIVAACDHIGIGESTPYEPFTALTKQVVVDADRATSEAVVTGLMQGTLVEGLPPIINPFTIGLGHSMGGYLLTRHQAQYHTFDAVAMLGWSQLLLGTWTAERSAEYAERLSSVPDLTRPPRSMFRKGFHDENVPDDVVAADDALAVRIYPWVFLRDRNGVVTDPTSPEGARLIDVPAFLGFAARDLSPDPSREASCYPRSPDITTFVLPDSAHCFNFADTRKVFFHRLATWGHSVATTYGQTGHRRSQEPTTS